MTKKTALQLIATVALAAGFIGASGVSANAATTDTTDATNFQKTQATVGLTAGTVDPDGPQAGGVQLIAAPEIDFGTTKVTGATQTIQADSFTTAANSSVKSDSTTLSADIIKAVKDGDVAVNNPGNDTPWKVTVQAANFTNTDSTATNAPKLLGAKINFVGSLYTPDSSNANLASAVPATAVAGDAAVPVLSASKGNGVGVWMNRLSKDTNLSIDGGNVAGTYKSELTWTITNSEA